MKTAMQASMQTSWTFGQKLGGGFALIVAFAIAIGLIAVLALRGVRDAKDRVITVNAANLTDAARLEAALEAKVAATRRFLLTREAEALERMRSARQEFAGLVAALRSKVYTEDGRQALARIERLEGEHQAAAERVIELRKTSPSIEPVAKAFDDDVQPRRDELRREVEAFVAREQRLLEDEQRAATETAATAMNAIVAAAIAAAICAALAAWLLTGTLGRQIGSAIQHVQSSSAELQAAANQQASGAKEQATAMQEITTTIGELLATSRQIAESAQRVAQMGAETASSARGGGATVQKGQEASGGIKRQVDQIVGHMLELGRKAQQIGGILEITGELAEQTNILAINASIEAAGAGEAGKRFAVVADEIRKLADRVGASTKEIRGLIDETRSAVNTTVMATESGSKAVDLGNRQFAEVAVAFQQIADLVKATTEAAREIELSTRQQATAVEQVNAAIGDVALTTRETEASSNQTLQTAIQLTDLSRELGRFIRPAEA